MNLKWFAMGIGAGAMIAIFYTPKTGAETREMLREKIDDVRRNIAGRFQEKRWSITDVINEGQEVVSRKAEAAIDAVDASADKLSEAS